MLEDGRKRLIGRDGLVGMMDFQRFRMDLVHGDMKMLVLLLAVANGDVLMLAQPRCLYGPANDVFELGG